MTSNIQSLIQTLATDLNGSFIKKTRSNGESFNCLTDDHADWMQDVCRIAHGDQLPNDYRFEMIRDCLAVIIEADDLDGAQDQLSEYVPVYNSDLIGWLASSNSRHCYVDEGMADGWESFSILEMIGFGYLVELRETFDLLVSALEKEAQNNR
jgi:hypothetical protein